MTQEPPPTPVDDIEVKGQRRLPGGVFPRPPITGGGGGEEQEELDPDAQPSGGSHPCDDPETARIWNADAAAAASVAALLAKAASLGDGSNLSNREFGANLIREMDGRITLTEVSVGPTVTSGQVPNVVIQPGGATLLNWMGDVHNHPSGDGALSDVERDRFIERLDQIAQWHPERDLSAIAAYVVVIDGSSATGYRIYAHTRDTPAGQEGQEVNPLAQPCPGLSI